MAVKLSHNEYILTQPYNIAKTMLTENNIPRAERRCCTICVKAVIRMGYTFYINVSLNNLSFK